MCIDFVIYSKANKWLQSFWRYSVVFIVKVLVFDNLYDFQLNPQHTVPVLVDNGRSLWDSHAIITYLVRKFGGEDHPLYPTDCYTRARIDQRLHFNNGVLYRTILEIYIPFYFEGGYDVSEKASKNSHEAYGFLETFLSTDKYLVGDHLTVADLSAITSVTQMMYMVPIDETKYPKLSAWIKAFDALPYFHEENTAHRLEYMKFVDGLRDKNRAAASNV